MARPRPEQKPDPAPPATRTVLPMQLQVGDRFADETGEWEVVGRPHSTVGGKIVHARVRKIDQPASAEMRSWDAFTRISVRRGMSDTGAGSTHRK